MIRDNFLSVLRKGLAGLPDQDIDDILADYRAHFADGANAGRSEADVAQALGDPARLARELRTETHLRRWEHKHSAGNFVAVLFALIGLATVDVLFLAPLVFVLLIFIMAVGAILIGIVIAGLGVLIAVPWTFFAGLRLALTILLLAIGLLSGGIGGTALLVLFIEAVSKLLARYARLHYRLLGQTSHSA